MRSVLIVDDEAIVIRALEKGVHWDEIGVEKVYTAREVKSAREILQQHPVDVILCDIEMPHVNGLELVRWVKTRMPQIVVLLLTGHADFSYAKEAISLGVYDYLLKPVVYKDLQEIIDKALEESCNRQKEQEFKTAWKDNQESLMADFMRELVRSEDVYSKEQMLNLAKSYHLEFGFEDMFLMVYMKVKALEQGGDRRDAIAEYMGYVRRLFGELPNMHYLMNPWEETVLLMYRIMPGQPVEENRVRERAVDLIQLAYTYGPYTVSCYISEIFNLEEMNLMLLKLKEKSENNVLYDRKVYLVSRLNTSAAKPEKMELDTKKWIGMLEDGKFEALIQSVDFSLHHIVISGDMDKERLMQIYSVFMQMIYFHMKLREYAVHEVFEIEKLSDWQQKAVKSVEAFREFVRKICAGLESYEKSEQSLDSVVGRAKKYINEHMAEEISREEIAAYVSLSENYLSKIFKKETGYSISDYVLLRRMTQAKTLLIETTYSVSEIALAVGYSNSAYFIKMFKREVGKTPNEYRKEMRI